ncbi:MAG: hypothetical protein II291_01220 [Succinivibrio sp.]|nr:hypothetical protein [Succinivibrio sp.]
MTREQAKQNLIGFGIAEPTDEQITNYLNQIGAETKGYKDKLASAGDKDNRIAELEKELEKINKQNMSDIELANAERDKALSSVANLEKQIENMITKTELAKLGITGELADTLVSGNGKLDFTALGQIISDREKNAISEYEKKALENTPNPSGNKGKGEVTKTEAELIAENLGKTASATSKDSEAIIASYKS